MWRQRAATWTCSRNCTCARSRCCRSRCSAAVRRSRRSSERVVPRACFAKVTWPRRRLWTPEGSPRSCLSRRHRARSCGRSRRSQRRCSTSHRSSPRRWKCVRERSHCCSRSTADSAGSTALHSLPSAAAEAAAATAAMTTTVKAAATAGRRVPLLRCSSGRCATLRSRSATTPLCSCCTQLRAAFGTFHETRSTATAYMTPSYASRRGPLR
mmetsp:Transcript_45187/g.134887  ORF Transcript_45187/g.134887 Transcript_45187/m.134887 type:complete len:212 (+) Transcript_45187:457-1092(+)